MSKTAAASSATPTAAQQVAPGTEARLLVLAREVNWKDGQILALTQQVIELTAGLSQAQEEAANLRAQLLQKETK